MIKLHSGYVNFTRHKTLDSKMTFALCGVCKSGQLPLTTEKELGVELVKATL